MEWNTRVLGAWDGGVLAVGVGGWDVRMGVSGEGLLGEGGRPASGEGKREGRGGGDLRV